MHGWNGLNLSRHMIEFTFINKVIKKGHFVQFLGQHGQNFGHFFYFLR
jgi:hypothetical protein